MRTCRAMRRYEPRDVPDEIINELLDLAIRAPSSSNTQNWTFVVVRDAEVKHTLAEEVRKGTRWKASMDERRITSAARRQLIDAETEGRMRRNLGAFSRLAEEFEKTPVIICVCVKQSAGMGTGVGYWPVVRGAIRQYGLWGAVRLLMAGKANLSQSRWATAYPAVQNLLLAARAKGLGAVLTTPQLLAPPGKIEQIIGLPKYVSLAAVVPIGYPKGNFGPVTRFPPKVFRDRYGQT